MHKLSNINVEEGNANCLECGIVKIKRKPNGTWRCKVSWKKGTSRSRMLSARQRKKPYKKHKKDYCEKCGFVAEHTVQLDVDHIDGNHKNNELSNLQTLCSNCHRLKTYLNNDYIKQKEAPTQDFS